MSKPVDVKKTPFKGIKQNPSLLGFGCMRFPRFDPDKPDIDETAAEKLIDAAYARGVTYYDTAYPYHAGQSETFVGKALKKYPRDSFFLASKMPGWEIESVEDAERIFHEQLAKCQVDYFDYYLCHALNESGFKKYQLPGVMDFLTRMKEEGKIRHLGFSFHDTPEVLKTILDAYPWDFTLLQINYLDWDFQDARKQYEFVQAKGIPCMVMEPVRGGTLATLCEDSRAMLKEYAPDRSIASWAIRYVAGLDNTMLVLSGMSTMEHVEDNCDTLSDFTPLTTDEHRVLQKALETFLKKNTVPCTKCDYCMPCPEGVDIPGNFTVYNEYLLSNFTRMFTGQFDELGDKNANACIECGVCVPKCPQSIDIPARMIGIRTAYEKASKDS